MEGELFYAQIFLSEGSIRAYSSIRGELELDSDRGFLTLFEDPSSRAIKAPGKAMIHLLGDHDKIKDQARLKMMDVAKRAGYSIIRFMEGEPVLEPQEAFNLMRIPFT